VPYQNTLSQQELNRQLLFGLKKHLEIAQSTSVKKSERLTSLQNVAEVLEYVVTFINEAVPVEEQAILYKFFMKLLVSVKKAECDIHFKPGTFNEEIVFINVLINL
jgi:hypothetical protein